MAESIKLPDPLFKLTIRFSNGETVCHFVDRMIDTNSIKPEARYVLISSISCQDPGECTDVTVVTLRDVSFLKTERVTLAQLSTERRMAGMRGTTSNADDNMPKTLSQIRFV